MTNDVDPIRGLGTVEREIADACARSQRDPDTVTLVAASKTVPADRLRETITAGHLVYGENRVQEATRKWPALRTAHPALELHMIGQLQTNKTRDAVALFDVIQSVDRPSLCRALATQCQRQGRSPRIFLQVNTGADRRKAGVLPEDTEALLAECRDVHGLDVQGLMCIPPADGLPQRHFELLRDLAKRNRIPCLSMGMSADYPVAIAHGATHVRVGSAIFGGRPYPPSAVGGTGSVR